MLYEDEVTFEVESFMKFQGGEVENTPILRREGELN